MIVLAGANATGATVLSLDDPTVDTDQGSAFTASLKTAPFDEGPAAGYATLRRLVQSVILASTATVRITPIGDGSEFTAQALSSELSATNGAQQTINAPAFVPGNRFQMKVDVTAHSGQTELGESDQWFVQRRTVRTR